MGNIVSSSIGLIHLISCIIALILGLYVLMLTKGTRTHKQLGYAYLACMLIVNLTAFLIYRLYGKFGIFHWMAVLSCLTIFAGMVPMIRKKGKNYIVTHFSFMYWSVIGLYAALMAEIFSRLPTIVLTASGKPSYVFYKFVGIGVGLVMAIGVYFFIKNRPKWEKQFGRLEQSDKP